jgi:hypothetical protein
MVHAVAEIKPSGSGYGGVEVFELAVGSESEDDPLLITQLLQSSRLRKKSLGHLQWHLLTSASG